MSLLAGPAFLTHKTQTTNDRHRPRPTTTKTTTTTTKDDEDDDMNRWNDPKNDDRRSLGPTMVSLPPIPEYGGGGGGRIVANDTNERPPSPSSFSSPRLASTWDVDSDCQYCASCHKQFDNLFNRRHHCRLCGRVYCHDCSDTRSLIPPSALVLRDDGGGGGGRGGGRGGGGVSSSSSPTYHYDEDGGGDECDPNVTFVGRASRHNAESHDDAILRGRGLEARILLARQPQRTCHPCRERLRPLQHELRRRNSNAVRYNYVDEGDAIRRHSNSPLAFTLGHEVRKASYALGNLLPGNGSGRGRALYVPIDRNEDVIYSYHPPPPEDGCHVPNLLSSSGPPGSVGGGGCRAIDPTLRGMDGMRIPPRLLSRARGIAIVTCCKGG